MKKQDRPRILQAERVMVAALALLWLLSFAALQGSGREMQKRVDSLRREAVIRQW